MTRSQLTLVWTSAAVALLLSWTTGASSEDTVPRVTACLNGVPEAPLPPPPARSRDGQPFIDEKEKRRPWEIDIRWLKAQSTPAPRDSSTAHP